MSFPNAYQNMFDCQTCMQINHIHFGEQYSLHTSFDTLERPGFFQCEGPSFSSISAACSPFDESGQRWPWAFHWPHSDVEAKAGKADRLCKKISDKVA